MKRFKKTDDAFRAYIKATRPERCEICGRYQVQLRFPLSIFHILSKGAHPRLRYYEKNVLLACWSKNQNNLSTCHNVWHASGHGDAIEHRRLMIEKLIAQRFKLKTYLEVKFELMAAERMLDKLDGMKIEALYHYYNAEDKKLGGV